MGNFAKELVFKLDIIAPAALFAYSIIQYKIRKHSFAFSDLILIIFALLQTILNSLAAYLQLSGNNLWVYHVNCIATQIIFTFYFTRVLNIKKISTYGFIIFSIGYILLICFTKTSMGFPSYSLALGSGIIVIYALSFLDQIMTLLPTMDILRLKQFWSLAGILAYFGSNFFIFITYDYLSLLLSKRVSILWQFHNIFLLIGCILFILSIHCKKWRLK